MFPGTLGHPLSHVAIYIQLIKLEKTVKTKLSTFDNSLGSLGFFFV